MVIARYTQTPDENKAYKFDYSAWLDDGETVSTVVTAVTPITIPPLTTIPTVLAGGTTASVSISGGLAGETYTIKLTTTTTANQVKEDCIGMTIETACG